jgi:hypothetical protein
MVYTIVENKITTLETEPVVLRALPTGATPRLWLIWVCMNSRKELPPKQIAVSGDVTARIDHSRWLADCPHCNEAWFVSKRYPVLWCAKCRMSANGSNARRVVFPVGSEQVERLLSLRPDPTTRNWNSHKETVETIRRENLDRGIEVI